MTLPTNEKLHESLKSYFGYDFFKGQQKEIIMSLLAGNNVFVLMPTGGGKSLCYQLPAMLMEGTAIIISPLIALMKNQVDAMRHYSSDDNIAHFLNSSLNKSHIDIVKQNIQDGRTKLLYVAPESLSKEDNVEFLKSIPISFYAVDEAHCISEWGHDFRPEYRKIRPIINKICPRPIIALTATATPKVQHDIQKTLGITDATVFKSSFNRPNLFYQIKPKTQNVDREIIRFIKNNENKSGIIYCLSRKKVEELSETLNLNNIKALPYHAGMDSATRTANQDAFLLEKVDVVVATIAFGMGIDKPDVRYVIHYDIPKSLEGYYQETGRAGRDGGEGQCITYYSRKDLQKMEKFIQGKPLSEQEIGRQLLSETAAYAESAVCRRKTLLHYFGEEYPSENCNNCDNCVNPKKRVEAKEDLLTLLETVMAIKEKFKIEQIIEILSGKESYDIKSYGYDKLETFGELKGCEDRYINALIRQAILSGYLTKEIENYGIIRLTKEGRDFIEHPISFTVVEDSEFKEDEEESIVKSGAGCAVDPVLYSILKDLRKKIAKQYQLPPYVIFQDPSLEAMATTYPITLDELKNITGVGEGKAKRYGEEFIKIIKTHVEENEIERPEDLRVRNIATKSHQKRSIIECIDKRIPLDEIAEDKDLEFDELLDEIESIVYAGTKIDIGYYIDEIMDEEMQTDIFNYYKTSESDSVQAAIKELGDDYSEEEIRLVRIKFLSELAN